LSDQDKPVSPEPPEAPEIDEAPIDATQPFEAVQAAEGAEGAETRHAARSSHGRHGSTAPRRSSGRRGTANGPRRAASRAAAAESGALRELRAPHLWSVRWSARSRRSAVSTGVLVLIVAVLCFIVWTTLYRAEASVPAGRSVTVVIAKGSSGEVVATQLAKAGVVTNATMFRVQAQLLNATSTMKAGAYTLITGSTYETVIRRLQAGPPAPVMVTLTIPEGWGITRTAARVESLLHIPATDFIKLATTGAKQFKYSFLDDNPTDSLEGYLFPKTYEFKPGVSAADVINRMLTQFGTETAGLDFSYARSKGISEHGAITIASIIEREASVASDRPNVASVIYNRLAIHMRLQLDSTVQYALNGKANLTLADLQTQSPYNTYQNAGLPPGPICSPGLVAIQAALHPATTKYLYYILTYKDGRQSFATNYADFLKLKAQFKKGLK
jgi:UPF0755 protein